MKRILVLLAALALALPQAKAQDGLSEAQKNLRTEIFGFLKNEGFVPEIDDDGDITFKREGHAHWIIVSRNDDSPMFVTMMRSAPYVENYDKNRALHASEELNLYKTVKVECADDYAVIKSQMYLTDPAAFESVFYQLLEVMSNAYGDYPSEYAGATPCGAEAAL